MTEFYDQSVFPCLQSISDSVDVIKTELMEVVNSPNWTPWPEKNLWDEKIGHHWSIIPLYAFDQWATQYCSSFPDTCKLLAQVPGLRTALFSKMGPSTVLKAHTGWDKLANSVLRCHLGISVPKDGSSGVWVKGKKRAHLQDQWLVFDDSLLHSGYNLSKEDRIVLIVDIQRPGNIPMGTAVGGYTQEVVDLISKTIGIVPEK